ncbi:MAG TPA: family 16 glycoside hydrolase [Nitrospira sp.]|nr:family 16 glycoside hydrolase [Nitrospira sp.]
MISGSLQWMRGIRLFMAFSLTMWIVSSEISANESRDWTFDTDMPGTAPRDFVIGTLFDGRAAGDWKVLQKNDAPSPSHVFGQVQGKGAEHAYKVVLVEGTTASDLELEVSLLAVDGKADMGGGLIWRAADDRNYYLTRANPLEQNVRIYRVVKGVRQLLNNFDHVIDVRHWHQLRVTMTGCHIEVFFDKKKVFDLCDKTFTEGRIGLWTKSDAVTYFDNLRLIDR